jgi:hypothetical protein
MVVSFDDFFLFLDKPIVSPDTKGIYELHKLKCIKSLILLKLDIFSFFILSMKDLV